MALQYKKKKKEVLIRLRRACSEAYLVGVRWDKFARNMDKRGAVLTTGLSEAEESQSLVASRLRDNEVREESEEDHDCRNGRKKTSWQARPRTR